MPKNHQKSGHILDKGLFFMHYTNALKGQQIRQLFLGQCISLNSNARVSSENGKLISKNFALRLLAKIDNIFLGNFARICFAKKMRKFDEITNANIFGKKQKNNCKISLKSLQNANEYFRIFSRFL